MNVQFAPAAASVAVYDFVEVTITTGVPISDPFRRVKVSGVVALPDGSQQRVDGFCDAQDGSVYRVRFLATQPGEHRYTISFRGVVHDVLHSGTFTAHDRGRRGMLRVDTEYPYHFLWSGTGEHFFWNGTTTYLMAGCDDETIVSSLNRLYRLGINRVRVSLCPSRQKDGGRWCEAQVQPGTHFHYLYAPWLTARPDSQDDPGFDTTRFDVAYWQKYERLLAHAQKLGIVVSVVFFTDAQEPYNYAFKESNENEELYYRYALARLGAYANVEWCLTNEWKLFQTDDWVNQIGDLVDLYDPYQHLTTVHGHPEFPFRTQPWADLALYQSWDEHGAYGFMKKNRDEQAATGRPMPQVNEEYGYEDHYPLPWGEGRVAPARSADTRRRLAWEITMAGGYQTTGESAANGLGGWINGRGDDSMTMLRGYQYLVHFFTSFDWWRLEPVSDLCLAEPGVRYVLYLPQGGTTDFTPPEGAVYTARWYNPRSGVWQSSFAYKGHAQSPDNNGDWALLIES